MKAFFSQVFTFRILLCVDMLVIAKKKGKKRKGPWNPFCGHSVGNGLERLSIEPSIINKGKVFSCEEPLRFCFVH